MNEHRKPNVPEACLNADGSVNVDALIEHIIIDVERQELAQHRQQLAETERLWTQRPHVSIRLIQDTIGVSEGRARMLQRATKPPATLQQPLRFPEPKPKPPGKRKSARRRLTRASRPSVPARLKGFVYVVSASGERHKIGVTLNPSKRLSQLNTGSPDVLSYAILADCKDIYRAEMELHQRYAGQRIKGEWFELSPADLVDIRRYLDSTSRGE